MVTTAVLVLGATLILALSWRSLRRPGSHGFYRFFAVLALLVLIVRNAGVWFDRPWVPRQLVSWVLLVASAALALHGFHLLHTRGRSRGARTGASPDPTNLPFENTTELVTTGAYRYIRHPLYASLLMLAWGAALKRLAAESLALAAVATLFLVLTAKADERECLARFGAAYRDYIARTRMFIPFLI